MLCEVNSDMVTGRLTLSWVGKDQALLNTPSGGYEWVPKTDPRVSEVRLLRETGKTGEVRGTPTDNLLIQGDNSAALRSLAQIPEFANEYRGKVKLVYIDPPFNTGQAFEHYDDALEHSVWLTMMRDRLILIKELLAPDGSVWVHLDDAEMAYCRILMDEIFGRSKFVTTIAWQKRTTRENRAAFSSSHDYIIVFSPMGKTGFKEVRNKLARGEGTYSNPDNDPRGPWDSIPFTAQGYRSNQMYKIITPTGVPLDPPRNRCWGAVESVYKAYLEDGRVYFPKAGAGRPRIKKYQYEDTGLVPGTFWTSDDAGTNDSAKDHIMKLFPEGATFDTPKPEKLLHRVIQIATNPGDIVLDCFAGSGTTPAVAHKMGRRWVAVEQLRETVNTFTGPRLDKVIAGEDSGGVTDVLSWGGGGGYRSLEVAPSSWEIYDGRALFAEWVDGSDFAAVAAAQLGFSVEGPEGNPFCGRRGRVRLAVVDGVVDDVIAQSVLGRLNDDERVVLVGRGVTPDAQALVVERSPGSKVLKAPRDLINRGKAIR